MHRFLILPMLLLWSCTSTTSSETIISGNRIPQTDTPSTAGAVPEKVPVPESETESDWQIIPGKRIGQTAIGDDPEGLMKRLGRPDNSDAAMGKAWLVWYGRNGGNELDVFTTYADTSMVKKAVRQIRITTPRFQTQEGIHTGMALAIIRTHFPNGKVEKQETGTRYDVVEEGISFEVTGEDETCKAIIVYPPGGSPTAYLPIPEKR